MWVMHTPGGAAVRSVCDTVLGGFTDPTVPCLLRPVPAYRNIDVVVSIGSLDAHENKRPTILRSAFCGCCMREGDIPTYENTRKIAARVIVFCPLVLTEYL